jgi:diguanylate cyclase (GGDEF)-like protein
MHKIIYIILSAVIIFTFSGGYSYIAVNGKFIDRTQRSHRLINNIISDVAAIDLLSLINFDPAQPVITAAHKNQNIFFSSQLKNNGIYRYWRYDSLTGELITQAIVQANIFSWLAAYSILLNDNKISSIWIRTSDERVIGLIDLETVLPTQAPALIQEVKKTVYWQQFFDCVEGQCNHSPYVTNKYIDTISGEPTVTILLPYKLANQDYGIIGVDLRKKYIESEIFDARGFFNDKVIRIDNINTPCADYRICLSHAVNPFGELTFFLTYQFTYIDFIKLITFTKEFILLSVFLSMLTFIVYMAIHFIMLHQARDVLTKLNKRNAITTLGSSRGFAFVLIIDIDDFKVINDTFGHGMGDQVLVKIAEHLTAHTRAGDIVCRWGGEEFVIVYRGVIDDATMVNIAKRLLATPIKVDGIDRDITFSGGLIRVSDDVLASIDTADRLLYQVKHNGKNNIMMTVDDQVVFIKTKTNPTSLSE